MWNMNIDMKNDSVEYDSVIVLFGFYFLYDVLIIHFACCMIIVAILHAIGLLHNLEQQTLMRRNDVVIKLFGFLQTTGQVKSIY